MTNYKAYIKNITTGEWLKDEVKGKITHTSNENEILVFSDEVDAESTLEYLNDSFSDAYVLLDDSKETTYLDDIEVAGILEGKGYTFYKDGEFDSERLSEVALEEGYEWDETRGNSGWYFADSV